MKPDEAKKETLSWLGGLKPAAYAAVVAGIVPILIVLVLLVAGILTLSWPILPAVAYWARQHRDRKEKPCA